MDRRARLEMGAARLKGMNKAMNDDSTQSTVPRDGVFLLEFQDTCPDCGVAVGQSHLKDSVDGGCDIARCLVTGQQRLMCDRDHDCGHDLWEGVLPGPLNCYRLGWMLGPGDPDLRRLYTKGMWDARQRTWVDPRP